ncbi:transient receptor potential cation channel subfamily V member 6-like [Rhinatrema bivittatum]|uniref:transient receptor potential cation channel subfamily V member 6-like n=1 Tax=Rhinatrema bivittatum TaxID=194408 RepID=UPI001127BA55|nr:transient receptor potential cation channel subfamily V member 6-like [Rhinatrema bivittatum]
MHQARYRLLAVIMNESLRTSSPLFRAAKANDYFTMKALLESKDVDPLVRGNFQETILHTALLNGSREVAELILDKVPALINEPVTIDKYKGETPLHIAILKQDVDAVQHLLKRGADVIHARAFGTCFLPGKESLGYFGEYPLSFAACTGNEEIIRLLISYKAPLEAQDSLGNTVLHMLVLQSDNEMVYHVYDLLTMLLPQKTFQLVESLTNKDGLTPLKLAVSEGDAKMFNYLVQKQKKAYWTMGTISYCIYDLTYIDSWSDQKSVLDIITTSKNPQVRNLLDTTPIKELLNHKWQSFGHKNFLIWMCSYMMYIVIFTICSLYRPLEPMSSEETNNIVVMKQKTLKNAYRQWEDFLRLAGELITVIGAIVILINEVPYLIRIGFKNYIGNASIGGPFPLLMVGYSIVIFVVVLLRCLGNDNEAVALSIALIIGWCNSIYFARGFKMLGQFSIMIQKILFVDLLQWVCLVIIIIIGFTSAFYIMFQTLDLRSYPQFKDFSMTLYTTIDLMMGLINLPVPADVPSPPLIYMVYAFYMVFVYLLMMNILIAMMDDTYWRIAKEREQLWKMQVASTILLLERRVPRFLKTQSGIPGSTLGFDDSKWYIGVEEVSDKLLPEKFRRHGVKVTRSGLCWSILRKNITQIIGMNGYPKSTSL